MRRRGEHRLQGTGISAGAAVGPVFRLDRGRRKPAGESAGTPAEELSRFEEARKRAKQALTDLSRRAGAAVGGDEGQLFETHALMLEDPDLLEGIQAAISGGSPAERAVEQVLEGFALEMEHLNDPYMSMRAADLRDVKGRLLALLWGETRQIQPDCPSIVAADELMPSDTIQLDRRLVLAFVTRVGGADCHAAILARAMGIPAVSGVDLSMWSGETDLTAAVDGCTGEVVLYPDQAAEDDFAARRQLDRRQQEELWAYAGQPTRTRDGAEVLLCCNIGSPEDAKEAAAVGGEGVGLFRSEFLYLGRQQLSTEEEQLSAYRAVLETMPDRPVVVRTLDLGADKQVPGLSMGAEENPALGLRGIRLCLERPQVFRTQLRALYRASVYGRLHIMFPMIASCWELEEALEHCCAVRSQLAAEGLAFRSDVPLGIMIETPAAVLTAEELARKADFFSIGTNDLTQYLTACDRQNGAVSRYADPHHPALLRAIRHTVECAHRSGIRAGICGELAADQSLTQTFLEMGVDELSVSPARLLELRRDISRLTLNRD